MFLSYLTLSWIELTARQNILLHLPHYKNLLCCKDDWSKQCSHIILLHKSHKSRLSTWLSMPYQSTLWGSRSEGYSKEVAVQASVLFACIRNRMHKLYEIDWFTLFDVYFFLIYSFCTILLICHELSFSSLTHYVLTPDIEMVGSLLSRFANWRISVSCETGFHNTPKFKSIFFFHITIILVNFTENDKTNFFWCLSKKFGKYLSLKYGYRYTIYIWKDQTQCSSMLCRKICFLQ